MIMIIINTILLVFHDEVDAPSKEALHISCYSACAQGCASRAFIKYSMIWQSTKYLYDILLYRLFYSQF